MDKMTAKVAMKILKGERSKTLRELKNQRLTANRLALASEGRITTDPTYFDATEKRVKEAYEYALAALTLARKSGKSAVKECQRQGLVIGYTGDPETRTLQALPLSPEAQTQRDAEASREPEPYEDDDSDEDDENDEF